MVTTKTRINASLSVSLGVLLLVVSATAMSAGRNASYVEACKSEVRQHYGKNMEVMVVSKRRIPSGAQVKLAARLDRDNIEFINCWVPSNEAGYSGYGRDSNTFATRLESVSTNHSN